MSSQYPVVVSIFPSDFSTDHYGGLFIQHSTKPLVAQLSDLPTTLAEVEKTVGVMVIAELRYHDPDDEGLPDRQLARKIESCSAHFITALS